MDFSMFLTSGSCRPSGAKGAPDHYGFSPKHA